MQNQSKEKGNMKISMLLQLSIIALCSIISIITYLYQSWN